MARGETTIGIIGLGLIGGSAALRLRESGFAERFIGFDSNSRHAQEAVELGLIDESVSLEVLIELSQIILIAIPVNHALQVLPTVMNGIDSETTVLDFGSTKQKIAKLADSFENRHQFVACHPIAGTENTGPKAAFSSLYDGKVNIICDITSSSENARTTAEAITKTLGMDNKFMKSKEHDRHIAYVSHMSHVSSFILGQTVLDVEKNEQNIFDMAGSGFASTVRLAKSSPEMWAPIFTENSANVLEVVDQYIANLTRFRELIENKDEIELKRIMQETNVIRNVLKRD